MQDSDKEHHPILQGWLEKEKRSSSLLSSSTTKRWFAIEESAGTDVSLSYYKSPRANSVERCGWIFLADVDTLDESAESNKVTLTTNSDSRRKCIGDEDIQWVIIIHHPSRTFRLRAKDRYQHRLWFDTLKEHCVNATNKEEKENEQDLSPPKVLDKLKPAGAFHKDLSNNAHQTKPARNTSVELNFMRSINGNEHTDTSGQFMPLEDDSDGRKSTDDSDEYVESDSKLVDDEDMIRYLQAVSSDIAGRDDQMATCTRDSFDDNASTEKYTEYNAKENTAPTAFQNERDNYESHHDFEAEHRCSSNSAFDHRTQSICHNNGNETIHNRLHRAILSTNDASVDNYHDQSSPDSSQYDQEHDLETAVQQFSVDSDSDEESICLPVRAKVHITSERNWDASDSQSISNKEESSSSSFGSRGKGYSKDNSWDEEAEDSKPTSKVSDKKHSLSFDSNCSYLPDDDFATANWDSD